MITAFEEVFESVNDRIARNGKRCSGPEVKSRAMRDLGRKAFDSAGVEFY